MIIGLVSSSAPKLESSPRMTSTSLSPSRRPLASETSTRWTSRRVRSMCRRNCVPRPAPVCAPSINPEMSFFPRTPFFMFPRSLVSRRGELCVAASAASAAADNDAVVRVREIVNDFSRIFVIHNRPDRNFQDDALTIAAGFFGAFTVPSTLGGVFGIEAEMDKRVVALAGFHPDVTTFTAVTAGWSSAWDEFFPPEGHTAVSAVAGLDSDFGFIDEHQ